MPPTRCQAISGDGEELMDDSHPHGLVPLSPQASAAIAAQCGHVRTWLLTSFITVSHGPSRRPHRLAEAEESQSARSSWSRVRVKGPATRESSVCSTRSLHAFLCSHSAKRSAAVQNNTMSFGLYNWQSFPKGLSSPLLNSHFLQKHDVSVMGGRSPVRGTGTGTGYHAPEPEPLNPRGNFHSTVRQFLCVRVRLPRCASSEPAGVCLAVRAQNE